MVFAYFTATERVRAEWICGEDVPSGQDLVTASHHVHKSVKKPFGFQVFENVGFQKFRVNCEVLGTAKFELL